MIADNRNPPVSRSNATQWRRWDANSISVFARVATIRWPNTRDFGGRPLPPTPELTTITSGLSSYYRLHTSYRELSNAMRRAVLSEIAKRVHDAVADLRRHDLDLLWRVEARGLDDSETSSSPNRLAAALAIDRLR